MTFWVYKLTYDTGAAPHVRHGLLSLAICKPRIRAGAARGDVAFGFPGHPRAVNRGERLIYIAEVTDKLETPGEYYERAEYRDRWDCICERRGGRVVWRPGVSSTRTAPPRTRISVPPRCIRAPSCSSATSSGT